MWPHLRLPRYQIVADAPRTSRSYVLASLRALHLDLRLIASGIGSSRGSRASRPLTTQVGPNQADIEAVRFGVGPLQGVRVGPSGGVITRPACRSFKPRRSPVWSTSGCLAHGDQCGSRLLPWPRGHCPCPDSDVVRARPEAIEVGGMASTPNHYRK
jgi:hypothetical protein